MTFRAGMKVACVTKAHSKHPGLFVGAVYTVASVVHRPDWTSPGLLLVEIAPSGTYQAFESLLFRPIVEPKSEISFTHGADPSTDGLDNRRKVREPV